MPNGLNQAQLQFLALKIGKCASGMKYKEFGDAANPTVLLLHGEKLSWWSFTELIELLRGEYHIVMPIIDGHGEDAETTFISAQDSAEKLIRYIDENHRGKVLALCGVSLGTQIVVEVLSKRARIATYAVVESVLVTPRRRIIPCAIGIGNLAFRLLNQRWFAKIEARRFCVKRDLFEQYYRDSSSMSTDSLIHVAASNAGYAASDALKNTETKVLIVIGSKEIRRMDQSVRKLMGVLSQAQVCIVPGMRHGELNLKHCAEYLALIHHYMV